MSASKKRRGRKKRRQARAGQRHGRAAYPRHTSRAGRTGAVHSKKTPSKAPSTYLSATPPRTIRDSVRCVKCGALPGELHQH